MLNILRIRFFYISVIAYKASFKTSKGNGKSANMKSDRVPSSMPRGHITRAAKSGLEFDPKYLL